MAYIRIRAVTDQEKINDSLEELIFRITDDQRIITLSILEVLPFLPPLRPRWIDLIEFSSKIEDKPRNIAWKKLKPKIQIN